jgi:ArsR family transcriptional regulator, arsenate/arsenite/antimonite-responsive transcriptional repressor
LSNRLPGVHAVASNAVFRALADPTRREILRLLRGGEMSAGELAKRFEMTKPSMSHHFTVLKQADLVLTRRDGQQIIYALNTTVMQDLAAILWDLFAGHSANSASSGQPKEPRP